jgi:predicted MPP superfamily phosphohydrolase
MRPFRFYFIILSVFLLVDWYFFKSVKSITFQSADRWRPYFKWIYLLISLLSILGIIFLNTTSQSIGGKVFRTYLAATIIGFFLAKLLGCCFFLIDDIRRFFQWSIHRLSASPAIADAQELPTVSRSVFLSWLGVAAGGTLFTSMLYGFKNKYNYQLVKKELRFKNLPKSFQGLKILHISDIHSGSFMDAAAVERGIDMILAQQADLVLFTGDLVNNMASEMIPFQQMFSRIKAPMGVFSILGNHDYGDYVQWPVGGISKEENLNRLKQIHADMGWRLLMNEHIIFERGDDKIALLGVENWGAKARFPKYGKLDQAYQGTETIPFKILMSHDPSHWDVEVTQQYRDIDLTLSGHTHGMQYGVELPFLKWSPIKYVYPHWAGLYHEGDQQLYVNRGYGFLGYPGRVGVMPEITVLQLNG